MNMGKILQGAASWLVIANKALASGDDLPMPADEVSYGLLCGLILACKCQSAQLPEVLQAFATHWAAFPDHCLDIDGAQQAENPNQET